MKWVLVSLSCLLSSVYADDKKLEVTLGAEIVSASTYRGLLAYNKPTIHPTFDIEFVSKHSASPPVLYIPSLHFSMVAVETHYYLTDFLQIHLGVEVFPGGELIKLFEDKAGDRLSIKKTLEIFGGAKFILHENISLSGGWHRDIMEHNGNLYFISTFVVLWKFGSPEDPVAVLDFFGLLNFGDQAHNRFFYGEPSETGLSSYTAKLAVTFPDLFWKKSSIGVGLTRSGVIGDNREGNLLHGHKDHHTVSLKISHTF